MADNEFYIIRFISQNKKNVQTDLVPKSWVVDEEGCKMCYYPPKNEYNKIDTYVKQLILPKEGWKKYKISILSDAADYSQGKRRLERTFTNIDTDLESCHSDLLTTGMTKRTSEKLIMIDEEDAEEELNSIHIDRLTKTGKTKGNEGTIKSYHEKQNVLGNNSRDDLSGRKNFAHLRKIRSSDSFENLSGRNSSAHSRMICSPANLSSSVSDEDSCVLKEDNHADPDSLQSNTPLRNRSPSNVSDSLSDKDSSRELREGNFDINSKTRKRSRGKVIRLVSSDEATSSEETRVDKEKSKRNLSSQTTKRKLTYSDDECSPLQKKKKRNIQNVSPRTQSNAKNQPETNKEDPETNKKDNDDNERSPDVNSVKELAKKMKKQFKAVTEKISSTKRSLEYTINKNHRELMHMIPATSHKLPPKEMLEISFPIDNLKDFQSFDKKIKDNEDMRNALVDIMQRYCNATTDYKEACRKILTHIMKKNVQEQFSGQGKSADKENFSQTNIYDRLQSVITTSFTKVTRDILISYIGKWLIWAKDREGGRKNRKNEKAP